VGSKKTKKEMGTKSEKKCKRESQKWKKISVRK
jgi:hypothetical protein